MSDIQELFARDPLKLTRPETEEIVAHLRANRNQYKLIEKTGAVKEPKAAKPAKTKAQLDFDIKLEDLL